MHVNMLSISFAFLQKCAPYLDIIIGVLQHKGCNKQQAAAQFRWFDVTLWSKSKTALHVSSVEKFPYFLWHCPFAFYLNGNI